MQNYQDPLNKIFDAEGNRNHQQDRQTHSPLRCICHAFGVIGATLTFIRNFIANIVLLLIIAAIYLMCTLTDNVENAAREFSSLNSKKADSLQQYDSSVVYFPLTGYISEIPQGQSDVAVMMRELNSKLSSGQDRHSIEDIEKALSLIGSDEDVKEVVFDLSGMHGMGFSGALRIADAVEAVKNSGKQVTAVADSYTQLSYIIASRAGRIYLDPLGSVLLKGLSFKNLYYSRLLKEFRLHPYVFRAGEFKSAVEPATRENMSEQVKEEYTKLAGDYWNLYLEAIAPHFKGKAYSEQSALPEAPVYISLLESAKGDIASLQKQRALVDELTSPEELSDVYAKQLGTLKDSLTPKYIDYKKYLEKKSVVETENSSKIAVVYGIGEITDVGQSPDDFSADNIVPLLNDIAVDKEVKALVLYLNSPGGSVSGSEAIRRALQRVRDNNKKVICYFNDLAASGAYLIATASDRIVASKQTITGSIGVFALGLGADELLNEYGIYSDGVATHDFADSSLAEPMNDYVQKFEQLEVNHTYSYFIKLVSKSRKLNPENYREFAEGKIFLAEDARKLGLVDSIGTFSEALELAVKESGLKPDEVQVVNRLSEDLNLSFLQNFFFGKVCALLPEELAQYTLHLLFNAKYSNRGIPPEMMAIGPEMKGLSAEY